VVAKLPLVTVAAALGCALSCGAQDAQPPEWDFSATGYYYLLDDESDYLLAIATAKRGRLHLEARYNYEAADAGSLFAGWTFSGGEAVTYELTPILGTVLGDSHSIVPGLEASVAFRIVDFYTEAEYVHDLDEQDDSFTYAWSELGFSPLERWRIGVAGQRLREHESERDTQRGIFAQFTSGAFTYGAYVFNLDADDDRFAVLQFGAEF
jgi:hypothetical protein